MIVLVLLLLAFVLCLVSVESDLVELVNSDEHEVLVHQSFLLALQVGLSLDLAHDILIAFELFFFY